MEVLKTLNDIKIFVEFRPEGVSGVIPTGSYVRLWELKQEAIKWIKELEIGDNPLLDYKKENPECDDAVIRFIKYFFNIKDKEVIK